MNSIIFTVLIYVLFLQTDIISPRNAAIEKGLLVKSKETFGVRRKDFWDATVQMTHKLLSPSFLSQLRHEPDGLIFQPEYDVSTVVGFKLLVLFVILYISFCSIYHLLLIYAHNKGLLPHPY